MSCNVIRLVTLSLIVLMFSLRALPAMAQDDAQRAALRGRIDFTNSRIILAPPVEARSAQPPVDPRSFAAAVQRLTGARTVALAPPPSLPPFSTMPIAPDGAEATDASSRGFDSLPRAGDASCAVYRGTTELHDIEVHMSDIAVLVRGADRYVRAVPSPVRDEAVLAQAMDLAKSLGAVPQETRPDVRVLAVASRLNRPGALPGPSVQLGKKVFLDRAIGNVEVAGQRLVMTFNLDGRLRKVRGRWTPIDYARSRLRSQLTQAEFIERAVSALVNAKVPASDKSLPILLFTYFKPGLAQVPCGPVPVELRGAALVEMAGPEGSNPVVYYDFAI